MKNVVLTGIGGQGTVLAAKILAQAAQARGWHVRTAETIGMAQRGGSVVSHVRMGDAGEQVASPLVPQKQADMLIAFEPSEGARMRGILKRDGVMVTASRAVQPVTASLSKEPYDAAPVLDALHAMALNTTTVGGAKAGAQANPATKERERAPREAQGEAQNSEADSKGLNGDIRTTHTELGTDGAHIAQRIGALYVVDETPILNEIGNPKVLNIVLLTVAAQTGVLGITLQELKEAVAACVKPRFCEMNLAAVDTVCKLMSR